MKLAALLIATTPTPMALEYPECTPNALLCLRYEAFYIHGPFDYTGAIQAGLERNILPSP